MLYPRVARFFIVRIKAQPPEREAVLVNKTKALVGASSIARRADWRAHFIVYGATSVGATAVFLALPLAALIGMVGLGFETGLWYTIKRANQSAADVAALSGAFEVLAGQPYSEMCGFAKRDTKCNGFVFASYTCPASSPACMSPTSGQMCANNPPVLEANAGSAKAFEVMLSQNQNTVLASLSSAGGTLLKKGSGSVENEGGSNGASV
jgi:uncharacterized membrane protein